MATTAQITISLDEYNAVIAGRQQAEADAQKLREQLVEAKLADPAGRVLSLTALARTCLEIVRFTVGNVPPDSGLRWPRAALLKVADLLPVLPDYTVDDRELATEFKVFAREVGDVERRRGVA
jgi:hypothetical protein